MKRVITLALALSLTFALAAIAAQHEGDAKEVKLFNGKNLKGWTVHLKDPDADPKEVFQVKDGAIWSKGDPFGYIRTNKKFANYKLTLEWRWPEKPTNSGVLLRMSGEDKIWPLCLEAQLKHERAGDVVGMGCDFNENTRPAGEFFRVAARQHDTNEVEPGGWNKYEITVIGDTAELKVNGKVQNKATGVEVEKKGYIGLQSEGSPIMFRNIVVTPLP